MNMAKKMLAIMLALVILVTVTGCRQTPIHVEGETLSEERRQEVLHQSFASAPYFDVEEGCVLTDAQIASVLSLIPSDVYEAYPDTHNLPLSATLYKNGEAISIALDDPRLIQLTNFFNNCVYYSKCAYVQSLLSLDTLEERVTGADFRLELTYAPYGTTWPGAYETCTSMCDTIVVTNGPYEFTLMAHDLPGYEGQEDEYPFCAVGFCPLYHSYRWLDLFGF